MENDIYIVYSCPTVQQQNFLTVRSHSPFNLMGLKRLSYDREMKTSEENRKNKRPEIEPFGWFIEWITFWLIKRTLR